MSEDRQLALLFLAERLGPAGQRLALGSLNDLRLFERNADEWRAVGLSEKDAARLADPEGRRGLEERLKRLAALGARIVHCGEASYPYTVSAADRLPPILFLRGQGAAWRREGVAVVGSRKPSGYGREVAQEIGREAAARGVPVISGAAEGIDTAAHLGALDARGTTVAVLGFGLFNAYPASSRELLERIAGQGALVSQFPPETPPDRPNFPIRNAVIAALAETVVVVEGVETSGAGYTADYARKFGRTLFAVPGDIGRPQSALPNRLLAEGAAAVTKPADPFDPLARAIGAKTRRPAAARPSPSGKPAETTPETIATEELSGLSDLEHLLTDAISAGKQTVDELLAVSQGDIGQVNAALLALELKGVVRQEPGRRYRRRHPPAR
ncbi:MAG: DNA-protecting protein DprA [Myxococcales bacterium]|nr:MAG: DNA-protecting protein DprA [Myxococcales bacterium]